MDNTFTLQPEEVKDNTDLQKNTGIKQVETEEDCHEDCEGCENCFECSKNIVNIQENQQEPEIPTEYKLRPLKDKDLFPMLQILRKVGIGKFKSVFSHFMEEKKDNNKKSKEEMGMEAVVEAVEILVSNIPNAETEIYNLWSELSGIKAEIIREMEFGTLPMMIMDTFMNARGTSFFKVLSKFF